jgi:AcrR family transcriptional regulator
MLDVAEGLFRRRGYHGVAVEEVTSALGMKKPNLYNHFRDKAELYVAVRQRCLRRLEADMRRAASVPGPFAERLFAVVAVLLRHPAFLNSVRLREDEDFLPPETRDFLFAQSFGGVFQPVNDLLRAGAASGELRAPEDGVAFVHDALIALAEGLALEAGAIPEAAARIVALFTQPAAPAE